MRRNSKEISVDYENSVSKSNSFSLAKLNVGLTLNQMQLFAFAIYSTQKNGETIFNKKSFEEKFDLAKYQTVQAVKDSKKISTLQFSTVDLENDTFDYINIFQRIKYDNGTFDFVWSDSMIPHILNLKTEYITTDLSIATKFTSSYSWTLYEYLKGLYGYWHKELTKEGMLNLFSVETKKSYIDNTAVFKQKVLDKAIAEINEYTELEVHYTETKKGRSIVGFDLHWTTGNNVVTATKKQVEEIEKFYNMLEENMFDYMELKEKDLLEESMSLIKDTIAKKRGVILGELTFKKADIMIKDLGIVLRKLESIKERDSVFKPPFYNWLEHREDEE